MGLDGRILAFAATRGRGFAAAFGAGFAFGLGATFSFALGAIFLTGALDFALAIGYPSGLVGAYSTQFPTNRPFGARAAAIAAKQVWTNALKRELSG